MRLERLYLEDVGPFDELRLEFGPRAAQGKADIHILTGENGTGKTTILSAIAAIFSGAAFKTGGTAGFISRRRRPESLVVAQIGDEVIAVTNLVDGRPSHLSSSPLHLRWRGDENNADLEYGSISGTAGALERHWSHVQKRNHGRVRANRIAFAAFAYAGGRTIHDFKVKAIEEVDASPFEQCLSFLMRQSSDVAKWIVVTRVKEALAFRKGDLETANRRAASVRRIEDALTQAVGTGVEFVMTEEPLNVEVKFDGRTTDPEVLPEGLKSIMSWVADLLMRLERVPWSTDGDTLSRPFLLLLDEIDVHLHPAWQRRILPIVQAIFPHAQVLVTTHSPLVVGSVSDAWVYPLTVEAGRVVVRPRQKSAAGQSYASVLKSVFGVDEEFDLVTEKLLAEFRACRDAVLKRERSFDQDLLPIAQRLEARGLELRDIVGIELKQVQRQLEIRP